MSLGIGSQNVSDRYRHNSHGKIQRFVSQQFFTMFFFWSLRLKIGDVLLQQDEDLGPPIFFGYFLVAQLTIG